VQGVQWYPKSSPLASHPQQPQPRAAFQEQEQEQQEEEDDWYDCDYDCGFSGAHSTVEEHEKICKHNPAVRRTFERRIQVVQYPQSKQGNRKPAKVYKPSTGPPPKEAVQERYDDEVATQISLLQQKQQK
jgi:hypothetical protein